MRLAISVALGVMLLAGNAGAADAPDPARVPALKSTLDYGLSVEWKGRYNGLDAWVARNAASSSPLLTTPDGKGLIVGILYDETGRNVTSEFLTKAEPLPPLGQSTSGPSKSDILYQDFMASRWIVVGDGKAPIVFMVVDPQCGYCKSAWVDLLPSVQQGKIQLRLIPVGFLGQESQRLAGKLFEVEKPGEAWNAIARGKPHEVVGEPNEQSLASLETNRRLLGRWNIRVTPFLVYRSGDGAVKVVAGTPDPVSSLLEDVAAKR